LQVSELGMSAVLGENGKTAAQPFENALPFKDDF